MTLVHPDIHNLTRDSTISSNYDPVRRAIFFLDPSNILDCSTKRENHAPQFFSLVWSIPIPQSLTFISGFSSPPRRYRQANSWGGSGYIWRRFPFSTHGRLAISFSNDYWAVEGGEKRLTLRALRAPSSYYYLRQQSRLFHSYQLPSFLAGFSFGSPKASAFLYSLRRQTQRDKIGGRIVVKQKSGERNEIKKRFSGTRWEEDTSRGISSIPREGKLKSKRKWKIQSF